MIVCCRLLELQRCCDLKKILIIEDKKAEADAIAAVINRVKPDVEIKHVDNLAEAYEYAFSNRVSIFIVDIVLDVKNRNDVSGLNFVENIRKYPDYKQTPIVFITSLEDRRLYAYEDLHCYKYLRKPLLYDAVESLFKEMLDFSDTPKEEKTLKVRNGNVIYAIPQKDIIYACSSLSRIKIFTEKDCIQVFYMTCKDLLQQLNNDIFVQCNRNTVVNINKIVAYDTRENIITMVGIYEKIKVGKIYKNEVTKEILRDD